ncbi:MAG: hypothetical protein KC416_09330, partial [Myxococcales bacterium]|nr:hypothetical protein [Myxococcales bacterium]
MWSKSSFGQGTLLGLDQSTEVYAPGCNATRWTQVGATNTFLGRQLIAGGCQGPHWKLVKARMDWQAGSFTDVADFLVPNKTPIAPPGFTLNTTYDPSAIVFEGETWVAFECTGGGFPSGASTCLGPLQGGQLDLARSFVAVRADVDGDHRRSASVPKLVVHRNRAYLYWTIMYKDTSRSQDPIVNITTRGIELVRESSGNQRLLPGGRSPPISTTHPDSYPVWPLGDTDKTDTILDTFDVKSDGVFVYAVAARGGTEACNVPSTAGPIAGCYRVMISRSPRAMGHHIFGRDMLPTADIEDINQVYSTFATDDQGRLRLLSAVQGFSKLKSWVIAGDESQVCDPENQPAPTWGTRDGDCARACSGLGGTDRVNPCHTYGEVSAGDAYDAAHCCKPDGDTHTHAVTCSIMDDGYSNEIPGVGTFRFPDDNQVCNVAGTCRRWVGKCQTDAGPDGHTHTVSFRVFRDGYDHITHGTNAIRRQGDELCRPGSEG